MQLKSSSMVDRCSLNFIMNIPFFTFSLSEVLHAISEQRADLDSLINLNGAGVLMSWSDRLW